MAGLRCFLLCLLLPTLINSQANIGPIFSIPLAVFQIEEELPPNSQVGVVEATDPDGDTVSYYIEPNTINSENFEVNGTSGIIHTSRSLDREALAPNNEALLLFVRATDGMDHGVPDARVEVRIFLRDINDNAPQFSNLPNSVTFPENTGIGTTIFRPAATDTDSGLNGIVLYRFPGSTPSGLFGIDTSTGDITLSSTLDFDAPGGRAHIISVEAYDRGSTSQSTVRDLTLLVNDTNDLSPLFTQRRYLVDIHENLTFGASVVQVEANDQDFGLNEPVTYEIISGNNLLGGETSFEINPLSGLIYVNVSSLDRETIAMYSLTVMATEINDPTKSDTAFVDITIFDVNDNSPSFLRPSYNATIPESTGVGMSVLMVTAMDRDHGTHAEFSFSFENLLNESAPLPFEISHDRLSGEGTISVSDPLDFETTDRYVFSVIATEDINNQPRNGSTTVYVDITNTNDNSPVFDNTTYISTVPENAAPGFFVTMVRATDGDLGTFGEVEYTIMSGHMGQFNITMDTGRVETTEELNYEEISSYTISIRAQDLGADPNLGVTELQVTVENLNDNPPMFYSDGVVVEEVQVNVTEQQPAGTIVLLLEVRDADGDLTPLSYEITNGNDLGHFRLNEPAQPDVLVTNIMLDHDLTTTGTRDYNLTVTVNDTENAAFLIINVQVIDINDNDPVFENTTYNFNICENLPAGSTVGVVTAADRDSGTFGEVRYSLSGPGNENFYINSTTGEIETTNVLDREAVGQFSLVATAVDGDTDPVGRRSSTVPVIVTVLDKNDNPPVFITPTYIFSVVENTEVVSSLSVRAQDMDVGDNGEVRYEIVSGNEAGTFVINNITGNISRNPTEQIDRESMAQYNLVVEARDGGDPQMNATALVRIDILDQNDISPQFPETQYNATIPEDIPASGIVTQVVAMDDDADGNGLLRYTIISTAGPASLTTGRGGFDIDETTGTVQTTGSFDREEFRGPYTIIIMAQDNGFPLRRNGTTELLVYLSDINDESPVFMPASYSEEVSEGLLPDQFVVQVEATDNDLEDTPNSEVYFEITSVFATERVGPFDPPLPLLDHFYVNATTGEIFTNVTLDYEAIRSYRITVTARDRGVPQRSSTTFVTVDVADINDEPPSFSSLFYTLRVREDTSVNSQFEVVMATDGDEGSNAELTFVADSMAPFSVDPSSGNLVLMQTIDFETRNNYTLNVTVMDGGFPTLYDSALVTIYIEDVNDNRPSFNATSYSADILEANYSASPMRIATVGAMDIDSGDLGRVTFEIISGNVGGAFTIGNQTGQVWVVRDVDKEVIDQYTLTILAEDGGVPPATSTAEMLVTVLDVNDNMPIFGRVEYVASVQENTPSGESIARVTATDQDEGNNGVVLFSTTSTMFSVDEVTGVITTETSFDYEMNQAFTIQVTARDNASSPMESRVNVIVNITDANDLAPSFSILPAPLTLAENMTVVTTVASVRATDEDSGTNGEVVYQLANDEGNFAIDAVGDITLVASLDREVTAVYNLTIMALDHGQPQMTATEYLIVTVGDINDETPEFSQDSYSFLVPEDVGSNSVVAMVTVTDLDTMMRGEVMFDLEGGGVFSVRRRRVDDAQTWVGEITTTTTLDYEVQTSYSLLIRAIDQAPPNNENVVNVTITILDTNDNAPQFSMPTVYVLRVPEEAPVSSAVGTIVATDSDGGRNGTVLYAFASGTDATITSTFSINQTTGVITLQQSLDYETTPQYRFEVEARDNSSVPMSSHVNVIVNVEDYNERAPVFDMERYSGSVLEGQATGQFVLRVNATEPDTGLTTGISYTIVAGATGRFSIDSSGIITTTAVLDREELPRYVLTVEARDTPPGGTSLSSYVQVDITVEDQNDNIPEFGFSFFVYNISENSPVGTVLAPTLLATDGDEGTNGQVRYSISTGPFNVDENTGVIRVSDSILLDREVMPVFNLLLTATDQGTIPMASTIDIQVVLGDVNDNSPEFGVQVYNADIVENSTSGVSVITVGATDRDDSGVITYAIQSGDDVDAKFSIIPLTGLIQTTSSPLDRETRDSYTLTVIATDSGTLPNTGTAVVRVQLSDRNDEAPIFLNTPLVFSVEEPTDRPLFITDLQTSDRDEGANADVMFFISYGNDGDVFTLNPGTGELFANVGLDFETQEVYNLRVTAVDQAPNPSDRLSSTTTVTVNVVDINDNTPVFSESTYETAVIENATVGETVLIVMAMDQDTGSNGEVTYQFQSPVSGFSINSRTGVITVSGVLDSETISMYSLTVEARDGGSPTRIGNANLLIRVININDNSPRFDRSFYVAEVAEDVPMDTTVATLTATDPDSPPSSLHYFITAGNDGGYFKINTTSGLIQTARSLDREQVPLFSLSVTAQDDGTPPGTGTTTLQVTILDVNDERPEFQEAVYYASVPENSPQGTQVLPEVNGTTTRIEAVDPDQPNTQNSRVLYRLEGPNSDRFNIDFNTGIVTVARQAILDRETTPFLTFTVVASDSVPPPNTQSSEVQLHISVADENDVAPMFTQPFGYAFAVAENLPVGTQLTTDVTAVDPDSGAGGDITYAITDATPLDSISRFNISGRTGAITLTQSLDRESTSLITLRVMAQDRGVPLLSFVVSVQISVSDVNDNPPEFSQSFYTTTVPEYLPTGASAFQVVAADPDISFNAEVHYAVLTTDGPFTINTNTGVLTTTATLDHETQDSYVIIVQACDRGTPRMCSNTTVSLTVEDFNDEAPRFDLVQYRVDVFEDTPVDVILQPVATDGDSGTNAIIRYSLQGEIWSLFSINMSTGQISLDRPIMPADIAMATYTFTVVAADSGPIPLTSSANVIVRVLNSTEHPFRFTTSYFYDEIQENSRTFSAGTSFLMLDVTPTPSTTDFFANYTENPFQFLTDTFLQLKADAVLMAQGIGGTTGLDRETRDLYTVIVRSFNGSLDAYTSVTLRVLDENDNNPEFVSSVHLFTVFENQTAPVTVGTILATDRDEGDNARIIYSIDPSTDVNDSFEIDSEGILTTERELDRETTPLYNLIILARNPSGAASSASVMVEVLDVNDHVPQFSENIYNTAIVENMPSGASVAMVTATDSDEGSNGMVRYLVIGGDVGVFQLDAVSGVITTLMTLDFERQQTYQLRVRATDMGTPPQTSEVTVNIQVEDFNDCPPMFTNPPTSLSLLENATSGSVLNTFVVDDCDSGLNGPNGTRFSIIAGNVDDRFGITAEGGVLYTRGTLDRETRASYLLSIQARDSAGANSLSSVTQVTVLVQDVNDNTPTFQESERQVFISVREGEDVNQPLLTITASDADDSQNGDIFYELTGHDGVFSIDVSTGTISLATTLDRETTDTYTLVVIARDRATEPRSSNATVVVTVIDENDNTPVIENIISGSTAQEVVENTLPGVQIFTVNATDRDAGVNGEVSYSLQDSSLPFTISPQGGVISVASSLDYETLNEYTLVIRAVDRGAVRQLTGIATLTVRILDANDNAPQFTEVSYNGEILENVAPGTVLLTVMATDADQTGTDNAIVTYSLVGGHTTVFGIDSNTGAITNLVALDREMQSHYFLTVLANNSQSHTQQFSDVIVNITVLDANDEVPMFVVSRYTASISELTPAETSILSVSAFDNDQEGTSNSELIFRLSRQTNNPFHLDLNTGVLSVQNTLDREANPDPYELTVVVEDKGIPPQSSTAIITITLEDENDEPPTFGRNTYTVMVSEVEQPSYPFLLTTVNYSDPDTAFNNESEISIVSAGDGVDPSLFSVTTDVATSTGQVFLSQALDREERDAYSIQLQVVNIRPGMGLNCGVAQSCQLSGTSTLEVLVLDVNDNNPVFERAVYSGEISTTAQPGSSVLSVTATDRDSGNFGLVGYRLVNTAEGRLRIDNITGTLFTRGSFTDLDGVMYSIVVTAYDNLGAPPSRSAQTTVNLVILNDFQRVRILFNVGIDTVVAKEERIVDVLRNISGLNIFVESYSDYSTDQQTNFIFHTTDPATNQIIDFDDFFSRIRDREDELIAQLQDCDILEITSFADLEPYIYPSPLDTQTIVILVLCGLLVLGSVIVLFLALRQRYVALHDHRNKLLADVFYTPSMIDNIHQEGLQLESLELQEQPMHRQNPMFVHPYDNWAGVDTSGVESIGEISSLKRDNPLYESQEIRMEMFADVSDEEEGEVDDAELLAAALQEDEEEEDTSVTAI